jgi:antitoxin (DNA-binding transcriptional repressor) of toxin-antitoxin stability system
MTTKHMKSREVRDNWRDVLDLVRAGNEVVVEHYNKPVARIVPMEEPAMTRITAPTRDAVLAWLGEGHGLTDDGISALMAETVEIGKRFPLQEPVHVQTRMDALWSAYQRIVTDAAPSLDEALNIIHAKTRTGVDPWAITHADA